MSTFLPDEATNKQNEIYKNDSFWRWLYLFPSLLNLVMIIVFILFIKEDSIIYNLSTGQEKQALYLINRIYDSFNEKPNDILKSIKE